MLLKDPLVIKGAIIGGYRHAGTIVIQLINSNKHVIRIHIL